MLSLNIPLGKYPSELYCDLAFKYLCNLFPQVPDEYIRLYFKSYNNLLIPTTKCFRDFLKEVDGVVRLNNCEINSLNPPRKPYHIDATDKAFAEDLQIIDDKEKVRKYVKYYIREILVQIKDGVVMTCSECGLGKPDCSCFSCSNEHIVCYLCFEKMVKQILRANGKRLVCNYSGGGCTGVFDTQDVKNILEPKLYTQLVERGVFGPTLPAQSSQQATQNIQPPPRPPPPPQQTTQTVQPPSCPTFPLQQTTQTVQPPPHPPPPPQQKPVKPPKPKTPPPLPPHLRPMTAEEEDSEGYVCPITRKIMKDPVLCKDGYTYEREAIQFFVNMCRMSPMTFQDADPAKFIDKPFEPLKRKIQEYLIYNPERDPNGVAKKT